ncbi:amidohydrolase family protein [Nonomuraea sp. FMUSA5-5]|uniref:Amidohydrolase family protein n=1 Tax=Nonomuraea composti TaxID=2720023 RepID=A0ABX1BKC8_9ACTN|nr:amidohydrolase family protein [Nonomuraea sp. FMUSA5-5]NJP96214.1 amidohydrolase family protein [Nonomuraea sp. FMUSA5-5]
MVIDVHPHHVPRGRPEPGRPRAPRLRVDSEREATILVNARDDLALELRAGPRLIPIWRVPLRDPDPACAERNVPVFVRPWDLPAGPRVERWMAQWLVGRFENAWHRRHDLVGGSERPPSHYLGRFSVDSAVFDERALRLPVDTLGEDHVMLGSDFPYPLGESPAGDLIRRAPFLSGTARAKLLAANAEAFLG